MPAEEPPAAVPAWPDSCQPLPFHENTWPVLGFRNRDGDPAPVDTRESAAVVGEEECPPEGGLSVPVAALVLAPPWLASQLSGAGALDSPSGEPPRPAFRAWPTTE